MQYGYPVILNLHDRPCVVIGGGALAEEKARGLVEAGARVKVVAPALHEGLEHLRQIAALEWIPRAYQTGDLDDAFLAVAADEDRSANAAIYRDAVQARVLINCLDDPPHCQFAYASIHRQGDLVIALSTTGRCPALAVRIRQKLADDYGPAYGEFLAIVGGWRECIAMKWPDFNTRRKLWYKLVDSPAIRLLEEGKRDEAIEALEAVLRA
jgi:siroheme synthase-like protein